MPIPIPDYSRLQATKIHKAFAYELSVRPRQSAVLYSQPSVYFQPCKITRIECFRFDRELSASLLRGTGSDAICGLLVISTHSGAYGLKGFAFASSTMTTDFALWASLFQRMKGLSLIESLDYVQSKEEAWGPLRAETMAAAVMDLAVKLGQPSGNTELSEPLDRAYLFEHAQAYVSF
ncbi:hypothetical protein [Paenibacillus aestuarii]|uniref:Uncharacterized protein n=1 Tax=Paenibacillus aestuarii TaxID=516965 RepID=A0ABW0K7S4_9BACL|nr:hypothetical protein [Paenibacillus aestuarii]